MLSVTGITRFYYLRGFTDIRGKHSRVLSVIREQLHRESSAGDIYIIMSKDHRIVRLFAYDKSVLYTILSIIDEFFNRNNSTLLYMCETGDCK